MKILDKISVPFFTLPPELGGVKIGVIGKLVVEPKLSNMNFNIHENKANAKYELSISKIKRVIAHSVTQA